MKGNGFTEGGLLPALNEEAPEHACLADDSCLMGTENGEQEEEEAPGVIILPLPRRQELLKTPSGSGFM